MWRNRASWLVQLAPRTSQLVTRNTGTGWVRFVHAARLSLAAAENDNDNENESKLLLVFILHPQADLPTQPAAANSLCCKQTTPIVCLNLSNLSFSFSTFCLVVHLRASPKRRVARADLCVLQWLAPTRLAAAPHNCRKPPTWTKFRWTHERRFCRPTFVGQPVWWFD